MKYYPGLLKGGSVLELDCDIGIAIGYYLEPLIFLAPFAKKEISIVLRGITNDQLDISVI